MKTFENMDRFLDSNDFKPLKASGGIVDGEIYRNMDNLWATLCRYDKYPSRCQNPNLQINIAVKGYVR